MYNKNTAKSKKHGQASPLFGGKGLKGLDKPKNFKVSFKKLIGALKQHKAKLLLAIALAVIAALLSVVGPLFLGKITDELHLSLKTGKQLNFNFITMIGTMLIVFYAVSFVLNYIQGFILAGVSNKISKNLRNNINKKIHKLPLGYFDKVSTGDTMSRITNDVYAVSSALSQSFSTFISSLVRVVAIVVIMFVISWQLALVAIISLPVTSFLTSIIISKTKKYFIKQQAMLGEVSGFAEEAYAAHSLVKVFDIESNMESDFGKKNAELANSNFKATFYSGLLHPVASFISNISYLAVAIVGASLIFNNAILVGAVASFVIYLRQLGRPVSQLISIMGTFQTALAANDRIFEILDEQEKDEEKNKKQVFKGKKVKGNVQFKNVVFGYEPNKPVIKNFSFNVQQGQKIAIVGATGAGKTTLINLLMRFYNVQQGQILIDGVNINSMTRQEVRSLFAMVLQDSWLFEATIEENLRYGNKNISLSKIEATCKKLNIDHFIKALPQGYQTVIDESASLSQGQKQLLTIARASLKNAPMLILDEATSSVDTRAEMLIQKAMDSLSKNKTSFVIAHRLSTIKNASQIIVMNKGKIAEVGNHHELLEKRGYYAQLYQSQFSEES